MIVEQKGKIVGRIRKDGEWDKRYKASRNKNKGYIGTPVNRPKKVKANKRRISKQTVNILCFTAFFVALVIGYLVTNSTLNYVSSIRGARKPVHVSPARDLCMGFDCIEEITSNRIQKQTQRWLGIGSWYGESDDHCVGCRADRLMANGERFNETAYTVAFNRLTLGKWVKITNLKTDDATLARVTDTGGFEQLGRIIDMSRAVKEAIACTDLCEVSVEEVL